MAVCTFWGHRDCPSDLYPALRQTMITLIEKHGVDSFYVGNEGAFDKMVRHALHELVNLYPNIHYAVVLAYMPKAASDEDYSDTMLPEGIETVHPHYAISRRNDWLLEQCDYLITNVTHSWGGAAKYAQKAERQKKTVINLA